MMQRQEGELSTDISETPLIPLKGIAGFLLFELVGGKQRFNGKGLDGEVAVQLVLAHSRPARDGGTFLIGHRAKEETMTAYPFSILSLGGWLEAYNAPIRGTDSVLVYDLNHFLRV